MWSPGRLYPSASSQSDATVTQQNMPFKCFSCEGRFSNSALLVQHIKDFHSEIVENAEQKIDQSKDFSATASKLSTSNTISSAACPYCRKDCQTRKLLMQHLELEHKDQDGDDEPEVKFIRLTPVSRSLASQSHSGLSTFSNQTAFGSETNLLEKLSQTAIPQSVTTNGGFVHQLLTVFDPNGLNPTDRLAHDRLAALKFPEKRYKCFWCDVSFRKRGKLMDHIDMFHKANKQQTEVEAEMIHGTSKSEEVTAPTPAPAPLPTFFNVVPFIHTSQGPSIITPITSASSQICMPLKIAHKMNRTPNPSTSTSTDSQQTLSTSLTTAAPRVASKPTSPLTHKLRSSRPIHRVCVFKKLGWLHRSKPIRFHMKEATINNCKFFHTSLKKLQATSKPAISNSSKLSRSTAFVVSPTASSKSLLIPAYSNPLFSPKDPKAGAKPNKFSPHVLLGPQRGAAPATPRMSSPPMFVYSNSQRLQQRIPAQQLRMPFFVPQQRTKSTESPVCQPSQLSQTQNKRYEPQDQPVNYTNLQQLSRETPKAPEPRYNPDSPLDLTTK